MAHCSHTPLVLPPSNVPSITGPWEEDSDVADTCHFEDSISSKQSNFGPSYWRTLFGICQYKELPMCHSASKSWSNSPHLMQIVKRRECFYKIS